MAVYDSLRRELFCGEALGRPQSTVVAPVSGFDPDAAIETIRRLMSLNPSVLFYSHGGVAHDPGGLMESVLENQMAYRKIILEGAREGESRETLRGQLQAYQEEQSMTPWNGPHQVNDLIEWHLAHFRRKGMI